MTSPPEQTFTKNRSWPIPRLNGEVIGPPAAEHTFTLARGVKTYVCAVCGQAYLRLKRHLWQRAAVVGEDGKKLYADHAGWFACCGRFFGWGKG